MYRVYFLLGVISLVIGIATLAFRVAEVGGLDDIGIFIAFGIITIVGFFYYMYNKT